MSTLSLSAGALAALVAGSTSTNTVGYAQATGYFKKDTRPTLYQPLNLLDGRDATAWCSPTADPLNELLTFGFNSPVLIEELRISTGNNFDTNTWPDFARAKRLLIRSGKMTQNINLEDSRGAQSVRLDPPLLGTRFSIEILDQYPSDDLDAPVCLTDILFVAEGKPLSGPWLTAKLKYDKAISAVMGTWYSGFDGTPDRFLSLNFDGSFLYRYEPFDSARNKEKSMSGTFDPSTSKIVFEVGGKKLTAKYSKDTSPKGGYTLSLQGDVPEELKGVSWRSSP